MRASLPPVAGLPVTIGGVPARQRPNYAENYFSLCSSNYGGASFTDRTRPATLGPWSHLLARSGGKQRSRTLSGAPSVAGGLSAVWQGEGAGPLCRPWSVPSNRDLRAVSSHPQPGWTWVLAGSHGNGRSAESVGQTQGVCLILPEPAGSGCDSAAAVHPPCPLHPNGRRAD